MIKNAGPAGSRNGVTGAYQLDASIAVGSAPAHPVVVVAGAVEQDAGLSGPIVVMSSGAVVDSDLILGVVASGQSRHWPLV
jgi:hypothetical protein